MTRALFLSPNLHAGGAERHWSILLPRLMEREDSVTAATIDGRGPFFDALQVSGVPTWTTADAGRLRNVVALRRVLGSQVDVIVSRATSADAVACAASKLRPAMRWATNWHYPTGMPIPDRRRSILKQVLPRADAVIAVCTSQVADLEALGVRPEAIHVIPNGTDFEPAPETRAASRTELGLSPTDVAMLLVGRLEPQKRVDRFIDSIARLHAELPQVVGLIAGDGPERAALEMRAKDARAPIRFLGRRSDIPHVLAASDVLVLTSDYEALPFVVLEAMATGRAVIGTRVGGLPDVVVDGETGLLCDAGDDRTLERALRLLAVEPDARARMGAAGRERQMALYSAEPMADSYAALLNAMT